MDHAGEHHVFTTLRFDEELKRLPENASHIGSIASSVYLLDLHVQRLRDAVQLSSQVQADSPSIVDAATFYAELLAAIGSRRDVQPAAETEDAFRMRFALYPDGRVVVDIAAIARAPRTVLFPSSFGLSINEAPIEWTVVLDQKPTEPSTATSVKTSDREAYNRARRDVGIASLTAKAEVLLYNVRGQIMDASITTPYFFRQGRWITPTSTCGGQQGVTRRWALSSGLCEEDVVHRDSLVQSETVYLSNAVRGFFEAKFIIKATESAEIYSSNR